MTAGLEESIDDEGVPSRRRWFDLRHLSIGSKLTFAFGILVALTLVVAAVAYLAGQRATERIERANDVRAPTARTAARAHANLLQMLADVQAYLALGDASYQVSYDSAREDFEEDLAELERLVIAAEGDEALADRYRVSDLASAYGRWTPLPDQLFALRDDQLQREPALRILIEDANPQITAILAETAGMIASQRQRDPTGANMAVLADLSSFQSSFIAMVSGLRGYGTTGRDSFKFEYASNLKSNDDAWEKLNDQTDLLEPNQQSRLARIATARETFLPMPDQMFAAVEGEHAREDLYLYRSEALPVANVMLRFLNDLTGSQQQLLQGDLGEGTEGLNNARWQTVAGGLLTLLVGIVLAALFRAQIVGPVRRLTGVAERVGAGDLAARATIESGDEIGVLAESFNRMTGQLGQTLTDLEERRAEVQTAADALGRQNVYLEALHDTTLGVVDRLDLSELLEAILVRAARLLDASHGYVYLVEPGTGTIERTAGLGVYLDDNRPDLKLGEGLAGKVLLTGEPLIVNDYDTWEGRSTASRPRSDRRPDGGAADVGRGHRRCPRHRHRCVVWPGPRGGSRRVTRPLRATRFDRPRQRAPLRRGRGGAGRRRGGKRLEERLPGDDEPRDPHPDERGHRHEWLAPRHRSQPEQHDYAQTVRASGEALLTIINDILDYSKIEAGRMELEEAPFDLRDCVEAALDLVAIRAGEKGLDLACEVAEGTPAAIVGDSTRLRQVLVNLLSNAVKFTERGEVVLSVAPRVRHRRRPADGPLRRSRLPGSASRPTGATAYSNRSARSIPRRLGGTAAPASVWRSAGDSSS